MADIRRLFSVLSRLRGGAEAPVQAAPPRKVMPLPPQGPLALPAPPKVLALPKPKPKPKGKPRGGQFFPDAPLAARDAQAAGFKVRDRGEHSPAGMRYQVVRPSGEGSGMYADNAAEARAQADRYYQQRAAQNLSPEAAARAARDDVNLIDWVPEGEVGAGHGAKLGDWLEKTLAKYYKTDFGTEADPLRDLAARGLHYDPDMTPERWLDEVNSSLHEDPIGYYTVPRHESETLAEHNPPPFSNDFAGDIADTEHHLAPGLSYFGNADPIAQGALMQAAPWLRKQPATDMLYGIREPLDLGHFTDEMRNAMNAAESGIPADLAVRPEMLERMSFPQAVERVGRINQWRVKQMEAERAAQMNNPAIHPFKEYPDGMRWVELKPPNMVDAGEDADILAYTRARDAGNLEQYRAQLAREKLAEALKAEGDTMGHCVGGYCDDVASGRSRIFSLRDAKGMPHVTIETAPQRPVDPYKLVPEDVQRQLDADLAGSLNYGRDYRKAVEDWVRNNVELPTDIVQIKGKQNRAPNPEYLPFVQDFVKSGQWGDIGDLGNTDLVRLPDQRFIRSEDFNNVIEGEGLDDLYQSYDFNAHGFPRDPSRMSPEDWEQFSRHFEGFKRGGLAVKKCGCMQCGGLAVKRAA